MTTRALCLGLLVVACTKTAVPEPRADAGADASIALALTIADAAADAAPLLPDNAAAWTDDIVVRELAKDCAWTPKLPKEDEVHGNWQSDFKVSPLACDMHFAQSCAPDPCYGRLIMNCGPGCAKACDGCGATCATKCTACKKDCTDDACKLACARSCGACHEECVQEADRCRTGKCAAESKACYKQEYDKFMNMGCEAPCSAMNTCYMECMSGPTPPACLSKCGSKMGKCQKDYDYACGIGWRPQLP